MLQTSESVTALSAALAKAQARVKGAAKDSTNPHFKSRYADLASIWDACREALTANGLSIVQAPSSDDAGAYVTTRLCHASGEWMESTVGVPLATPTAQALGSVITYLRRYALAAMVGVAPEDDDGQAATDQQVADQGAPSATPRRISEAQRRMLFARAKSKGIDTDVLKGLVVKHTGAEHTDNIPAARFSALLEALDAWTPPPPPVPDFTAPPPALDDDDELPL